MRIDAAAFRLGVLRSVRGTLFWAKNGVRGDRLCKGGSFSKEFITRATIETSVEQSGDFLFSAQTLAPDTDFRARLVRILVHGINYLPELAGIGNIPVRWRWLALHGATVG